MKGHEAVVAVLLIIGVVIQALCCVGILVMRNVYDRLHYLGPASTIGPLFFAAALVVDRASMPNIIKAIMVVMLLWIINPVLTHATARAARVREWGDLAIHTDEMSGADAPAPSPRAEERAG